MIFKFSDEIFLSVENIRVRKFYKKVTNHYLDSFRISEKINDNVYKLKLSNQYERLNDFFLYKSFRILRAKSRRRVFEFYINR